MYRTAAALIASILASCGIAAAASSDWQHFDGADLRAVVSDVPAADGSMRAAIEVALKPGWKTYWLDPGSSGVPPMVETTVDGLSATTIIEMPAPERLSDGYGSFAGYSQPITIAAIVTPPTGTTWANALEFSVFLGICETICIPVQAQFVISGSNPETENVINAAFAALPAAARADFGVTHASASGGELIIEAVLPEGVHDAALFVAPSAGILVGEIRQEGGRFRAPLLDWSSEMNEVEARYTLVAKGEAVSGTFAISQRP